MKKNEIQKIIDDQKKFFAEGNTKNIKFRIDSLKKLKASIKDNITEISIALHKDLGKSKFESYVTEIGIILDEISLFVKKLKSWSLPKKVKTNFINFPAKSFIYNEPYGVTLIISPWNYPFQLLISPLIGSIAAGNTAILKPSELAPATAKTINNIISRTFNKNHIAVIEGGIETNKILLESRMDFIFFTGSIKTGKIVMQAAAKNLTPFVLELGGKSPALVTEHANLKISAKRIVWGKFLNSGQTCVAPDYILIHKSAKEQFINLCIQEIKNFYGDNPFISEDFSKIISLNHFQRLTALLKNQKIIYGGKDDKKRLMIEPTLIDNPSSNSPIMKEEIFGPLLPIIEFENFKEALNIIEKNPNPLAAYIFSDNKDEHKMFIENVNAGGMSINDTIMQITNPDLPFGGISTSGFGRYHAKASFDIFSNKKSVLKQSASFDIPLRYPPYKNKLKMIKKILK